MVPLFLSVVRRSHRITIGCRKASTADPFAWDSLLEFSRLQSHRRRTHDEWATQLPFCNRYPVSRPSRQRVGQTGVIFSPNAPPYEREEVCSTLIVSQGTRLISLTSHTHKRGESFKIFHPDGSLIYENYFFSDPITARYEPPLSFDAEDEVERTLRYCAVYNNGVNPDGTPNAETVTRASRMPDSVYIDGVPGRCIPTACAAGKIGASCSGVDDHARTATANLALAMVCVMHAPSPVEKVLRMRCSSSTAIIICLKSDRPSWRLPWLI